MGIPARGIKRPNVAAVQCPHDADARHHGRAIELDDQEQGFDRGLPLIDVLLSFGKLLNIVRGVLEGDELATTGQRNRIIEGAGPVSHDAARTGQRRCRDDRTRCRASAVAPLQRSRCRGAR